MQIGIDEDVINKIGELTEKMKENSKQLMLLENSMKELQIKYPPEVRNTMPLYKKIDNAIFSIHKQQEEIQKEKEQLNLQVLFSREATITIDGIAHEGVTCILGKGRWDAAGERRVTLKGTGGAMVNVSNN